MARQMVEDALVPMVLLKKGDDKAVAYTADGQVTLPEDAQQLLGRDHPYAAQVAEDLVGICHHRDAGDLVINGWLPESAPLSFPIENGAHAGPGVDETSAFALLPADASGDHDVPDVIRPIDLRQWALTHLKRSRQPEPATPKQHRDDTQAGAGPLTVMTYNVHSCLGTDHKHSPRRIARVIAQADPDIVALQELDVGRQRSGQIDQAHEIAGHLRMDHEFHAALRVGDEQYGNAILSRYPIEVVKADALPMCPGPKRREPRGALWVRIQLPAGPLHVINTHIGLRRKEKRAQIASLLSNDWLGSIADDEPVILCGDLNLSARAQPFEMLQQTLRSARIASHNNRPCPTWPTLWPVTQIDHILLRGPIEVDEFCSRKTHLTRTASDHYPLLATIRVNR
jgi:endonuclease/exonuclease/phosphatase family metal-dependent hydrolase